MFTEQFSTLFSTLHSSISIPITSLAPSFFDKIANIPVPHPISNTRLLKKSTENISLQTNLVV